MPSKLNMIHEPDTPQPKREVSKQKLFEIESKAKFERLWLQDPTQFTPSHAKERQRKQDLIHVVEDLGPLTDTRVIDLGTGSGWLAHHLANLGANVTALDISRNALKHAEKQTDLPIRWVQDTLPNTKLDDDSYELVIAADLITDLHPKDYRVFIAELARIVTREGVVVISTELDPHTEGPLDGFLALLATELEILTLSTRSHRLWNGLPGRAKEWDWLFPKLEALTEIYFAEAGLTHATVTAKRKPLAMPAF